MHNSAFTDWFSFEGRRNRKSFIIAYIALCVTFATFYFIWLQFSETSRGRNIGLIVFGLPAGLCGYLLAAQRLRDFGVSGWFALLGMPINALGDEVRIALTIAACLVLCGIPGSKGSNKFGPDPLE
ncbi:MAG: DUF805 domain-containing protein [Sandarakinorhabdus sp.]